jgi:hypothetical protein
MDAGSKVYLSVEIPISGDGFPNPKELKARNAIIDELDKKRIGKFIGAGGGMGAMDFSYVVEDEARARADITAAVKRRLPDAEFTIEVSSADDLDDVGDGDEDEDGEGGEINWLRLSGCLVVLAAIVGGVVWLIATVF